MPRSRLAVLLGSSVAALGIALAACSATPLGASEPNLANAQKKAARGASCTSSNARPATASAAKA